MTTDITTLKKAALVMGCNKANIDRFEEHGAEWFCYVKNRQNAICENGKQYLIITSAAIAFVNGKKWNELKFGQLKHTSTSPAQ